MPASIIKSLAQQAKTSEDEVEKLWNKAKEIVKDEYKNVSVDSDRYYQIVTGIVKNMLKINENVSKFDKLVKSILSS